MVETNGSYPIYSVSFTKDAKQILTGDSKGMLRLWRTDDGTEIGNAIKIQEVEIFVAALSPDQKWLACGLRRSDPTNGEATLRVWDAQTREKVLDIHGHTDAVFSVDISSDSTRVATGSADKLVFIWSLLTGERLVGPLQHDWGVVVRFSPNGDRIATAAASQSIRWVANTIRIYNSNNGEELLQINDSFPFDGDTTSWLAWSADGRQLFAVAHGEAKCFDTFSGSLLDTWTAPSGSPASVAMASNGNFFVISAGNSLSFWDVSTHRQIGSLILRSSLIWSISLPPNDDCIVTGEESGKITFRSLRDNLPESYIIANVMSQWPLRYISNAIFNLWRQGDLTRVEELLTEEIAHSSNPFLHSGALAHRSIIRTRLKQWNIALDDAIKSIEVQPSAIGHIANAMAHVGSGEHELAMNVFDHVFREGIPVENKYLLLLKAIILFECGKHDDAISRLDYLIDTVENPSVYVTVRAQMFFLLGRMSMRDGDNKRAMELFKRAQDAIPFPRISFLCIISLMFGWDFDILPVVLQLQLFKAMRAEGYAEAEGSLSMMVGVLGEEALTTETFPDWDLALIQRCIGTFESDGDAAMQSNHAERAIVQYSTALCLNPLNPVGLLVKRSKAQAAQGSWMDALKDADKAIKADSANPWGYERRHAALHGLQRYDEAIAAFTHMLLLIERSMDQGIRELSNRYVSRSKFEEVADDIIFDLFETHPRVLIDVESGRLCDGQERMKNFKSDLQFKALCSSMTQEVDSGRILHVATEYFEYVMLSHIGHDREPSFQDVHSAGSVWVLDPSPPNDKLRKFCEVVRTDGYRWAWSGSCCIDRTVCTVLKESLEMMYKWYEESAATFILLASETSPSSHGDLTNSIWMGRAWNAAALLIPKVIRFYDCDWKPHLGDTRTNHKESPEIVQELVDALGVSREVIMAFNPDDLTMQEKLRLATTRNATAEEDAYSLLAILKNDSTLAHANGDAMLGDILSKIVSQSGDVTMLAWTGKPSEYNTCLPATLAVYRQTPYALPVLEGTEMDARIAELRFSFSRAEAMLIYERIVRLPPARFDNRKLYLPCIIFTVKSLDVEGQEGGRQNRYHARVAGIGQVDFQAPEKLSLLEPRKLIFVHPWLRDLRDPAQDDGATSGCASDSDESESESGPGASRSSPPRHSTVAKLKQYTQTLRLVVRLQQPFRALLLQRGLDDEFNRVAAEHEIVLPGLKPNIKDIHTRVVEIC